MLITLIGESKAERVIDGITYRLYAGRADDGDSALVWVDISQAVMLDAWAPGDRVTLADLTPRTDEEVHCHG